MSIDIRPAGSVGDLDAIRGLLRVYESEIGFDLGFQGFADELAALPGDYAPPKGRLLCAEIAGRVVGCVALRPLDEKRCEMKRLYVLPEARRERAGQALVAQIVAEGRAAGYEAMYLDTAPGMEKAQALYQRFGFRDVPPYTFNPIPGVRFMALRLRGDSQHGMPH